MPRYIIKKNNRGKMQIYDTFEDKWTSKLISDLNRLNRQPKEDNRKSSVGKSGNPKTK